MRNGSIVDLVQQINTQQRIIHAIWILSYSVVGIMKWMLSTHECFHCALTFKTYWQNIWMVFHPCMHIQQHNSLIFPSIILYWSTLWKPGLQYHVEVFHLIPWLICTPYRRSILAHFDHQVQQEYHFINQKQTENP